MDEVTYQVAITTEVRGITDWEDQQGLTVMSQPVEQQPQKLKRGSKG